MSEQQGKSWYYPKNSYIYCSSKIVYIGLLSSSFWWGGAVIVLKILWQSYGEIHPILDIWNAYYCYDLYTAMPDKSCVLTQESRIRRSSMFNYRKWNLFFYTIFGPKNGRKISLAFVWKYNVKFGSIRKKTVVGSWFDKAHDNRRFASPVEEK